MDIKYAKKILVEQFPNLKPKLLGEGYDNWVYEIKGTALIRIPKTPLYQKRLLQEVAFLEMLTNHSPVSVPDYNLIAADGSFGIYKKIVGEPLTLATYNTLKPKTQAKLAAELGSFIACLHQLPGNKLTKFGFTNHKEKNLKTEYKKIRKIIQSVLTKEELITVDTIQNKFFSLPKPAKKVLVHHDLSDEHILLSLNHPKIAGIIDFSDASFADPALDFAWLWELGEKFVQMVYQNYHYHDKTFLERSQLYWFQNIISQLATQVMSKKSGTLTKPLTHLRNFLKHY